MTAIGFHVGFMLSLLTIFVHLLFNVPSTTPLGFAVLPLSFCILSVIAVEFLYLVVSLARKRPVHPIFPLWELAVTASSIFLWWHLLRTYSAILPTKTLSNISETVALAFAGSMFYAMRCYCIFVGDLQKSKYCKWLCCVVIPLIAVVSVCTMPAFAE